MNYPLNNIFGSNSNLNNYVFEGFLGVENWREKRFVFADPPASAPAETISETNEKEKKLENWIEQYNEIDVRVEKEKAKLERVMNRYDEIWDLREDIEKLEKEKKALTDPKKIEEKQREIDIIDEEVDKLFEENSKDGYGWFYDTTRFTADFFISIQKNIVSGFKDAVAGIGDGIAGFSAAEKGGGMFANWLNYIGEGGEKLLLKASGTEIWPEGKTSTKILDQMTQDAKIEAMKWIIQHAQENKISCDLHDGKFVFADEDGAATSALEGMLQPIQAKDEQVMITAYLRVLEESPNYDNRQTVTLFIKLLKGANLWRIWDVSLEEIQKLLQEADKIDTSKISPKVVADIEAIFKKHGIEVTGADIEAKIEALEKSVDEAKKKMETQRSLVKTALTTRESLLKQKKERGESFFEVNAQLQIAEKDIQALQNEIKALQKTEKNKALDAANAEAKNRYNRSLGNTLNLITLSSSLSEKKWEKTFDDLDTEDEKFFRKFFKRATKAAWWAAENLLDNQNNNLKEITTGLVELEPISVDAGGPDTNFKNLLWQFETRILKDIPQLQWNKKAILESISQSRRDYITYQRKLRNPNVADALAEWERTDEEKTKIESAQNRLIELQAEQERVESIYFAKYKNSEKESDAYGQLLAEAAKLISEDKNTTEINRKIDEAQQRTKEAHAETESAMQNAKKALSDVKQQKAVLEVLLIQNPEIKLKQEALQAKIKAKNELENRKSELPKETDLDVKIQAAENDLKTKQAELKINESNYQIQKTALDEAEKAFEVHTNMALQGAILKKIANKTPAGQLIKAGKMTEKQWQRFSSHVQETQNTHVDAYNALWDSAAEGLKYKPTLVESVVEAVEELPTEMKIAGVVLAIFLLHKNPKLFGDKWPGLNTILATWGVGAFLTHLGMKAATRGEKGLSELIEDWVDKMSEGSDLIATMKSLEFRNAFLQLLENDPSRAKHVLVLNYMSEESIPSLMKNLDRRADGTVIVSEDYFEEIGKKKFKIKDGEDEVELGEYFEEMGITEDVFEEAILMFLAETSPKRELADGTPVVGTAAAGYDYLNSKITLGSKEYDPTWTGYSVLEVAFDSIQGDLKEALPVSAEVLAKRGVEEWIAEYGEDFGKARSLKLPSGGRSPLLDKLDDLDTKMRALPAGYALILSGKLGEDVAEYFAKIGSPVKVRVAWGWGEGIGFGVEKKRKSAEAPPLVDSALGAALATGETLLDAWVATGKFVWDEWGEFVDWLNIPKNAKWAYREAKTFFGWIWSTWHEWLKTSFKLNAKWAQEGTLWENYTSGGKEMISATFPEGSKEWPEAEIIIEVDEDGRFTVKMFGEKHDLGKVSSDEVMKFVDEKYKEKMSEGSSETSWPEKLKINNKNFEVDSFNPKRYWLLTDELKINAGEHENEESLGDVADMFTIYDDGKMVLDERVGGDKQVITEKGRFVFESNLGEETEIVGSDNFFEIYYPAPLAPNTVRNITDFESATWKTPVLKSELSSKLFIKNLELESNLLSEKLGNMKYVDFKKVLEDNRGNSLIKFDDLYWSGVDVLWTTRDTEYKNNEDNNMKRYSLLVELDEDIRDSWGDALDAEKSVWELLVGRYVRKRFHSVDMWGVSSSEPILPDWEDGSVPVEMGEPKDP